MGRDGKQNPARDKSYDFALRIIKLYKYLIEEKKEYVLSKQILKSGTSIGANVEEAIGGQSRRDFLAKSAFLIKKPERHIIGCACCEIVFSRERCRAITSRAIAPNC